MTELIEKVSEEWWRYSVVYQVYPRSFFDSNDDGIGDIRGIIMKLDYLAKLGVDIVWLGPIYDSPNYDNGYDIRDYKEIMTEFGTMDDFHSLLEEMKKRRLKLIMDLVVNHTSDEHPWFVESRKSKDNLYRNFYHWQPGKNGQPPNKWRATFGGACWTYDTLTDEYYLHTFTEKQPDLNWENPLVRDEVYKIMRWWLDKGINGFRMDVINFISKATGYPEGQLIDGDQYTDGTPYYVNGPHLHEYIQEMHERVLKYYDIVTIGECPGGRLQEAELFTSPQRNELNMIFTSEHMELDGNKWTTKAFNLENLKKHFTAWQKCLYRKGWNSLFWNNHDQPRIVSRWGNDSSQYRVLSAKMLGTCLHFLCGTPYIYQGEEIGMTNVRFPTIKDYRDVETKNFYHDATEQGLSLEKIMISIYAKSRDNARTPMQWSGKLPYGGFTTGVGSKTPWININPNYVDINAEQALSDPQSIFYYYQRLIKLRRQSKVIVHGNYDILHEDNRYVFMYKRYDDQGHEIFVACNFSQESIKIHDSQLSQKLNSYKNLLISNYEQNKESDWLDFRPYEAWALQVS